jgi:TonB family protein
VRRIVDTELPRNGSGYAQVSMMAVVALIVALGAQQGLSLTRALTDIAESARLQVSNIENETWSRSRAAWTAGVNRLTQEGGFYPAVEEAIAEEKPPRGQAADNVKRPEPVFTHSADAPLTETLLAVADPEPDQTATKAEPETIEDWRSLHQDAVIVETPDSNTATAFANTGFHPGMPGGLTREAVEKAAQAPPAQIKPLKTAQPRYPMRARSRGIEGFVKLRFTLDERGSAKDIEVADAFPEDIFNRAAIKALKKWKFDVSSGESTSRKLTQTFDFNLNDEVRYVNNYHDCAVTGRRTCGRGQRGAIVVYVNPPESRKGPSELK